MRRFIYPVICSIALCVTSCALGTGDPLQELMKAGDGIFVAVSASGSVLASRDGKVWITTANVGDSLSTVAYHNGTFIAPSPGSYGLFSSKDLSNWNFIAAPCRGTDVLVLHNMFYICGEDALMPIVYPTDGNAVYNTVYLWMFGGGGPVSMYSIAYGNGTIVAVGGSQNMYYSIDGSTWNNYTLPNIDLYKIIFARGMFTAVGYNYNTTVAALLRSADGVNWTPNLVPPLGTTFLYGVACAGERYVAVGTNGYACYSEDGNAWAAFRIDPALTTIRAVTYGGGSIVAAGDNGSIYYSENGIAWIKVMSNPAFGNLNGVTFISNPTNLQ